MKIPQICALTLLLVVGSALAFGDSITDPKIIVHGIGGAGGAPDDCKQCIDITGLTFGFDIPKQGSGTLYFTNDTGKNWTSLTLIETGEPADDISCQALMFLHCSTKTLKNGSVEILMTGVLGGLNPKTGITNGESFFIAFDCKNGCWMNGGSMVAGTAGTVPEPGTIALMVTGLGAIVSRRKPWKNRVKA
jgi:PEP-CTERM motif